MYFSIRKPTLDERQGARPPAVRMATFAYIGDGFRARGGVGWGRVLWGRGGGVMPQIWPRICRPSAVNGRAASAARRTRSRLPAALERATGPRERCQRRAAAALRHAFFPFAVSLDGRPRQHEPTSREAERCARELSRVSYLFRRLVIFTHGVCDLFAGSAKAWKGKSGFWSRV